MPAVTLRVPQCEHCRLNRTVGERCDIVRLQHTRECERVAYILHCGGFAVVLGEL